MSGLFQGNGGILGNGLIIQNVYPNPPTDLSASSILNSSAVINFTKPATPTTGYYVYNNGVQIASYVGNTSSVALSGLTASSSYVITISSYNNDGVSDKSAPLSFSTLSNIPNSPSSLSTANITSSNATISIVAPATGAIPSSYYYYSSPGIGGYNSPTSYGVVSYGGSTTTLTLDGLSASTAYTIYIASNNSTGTSSYTNTTLSTSSGIISGNYYTWGYNNWGYCGNGTGTPVYMPTLITNNAIVGSPMNKPIKWTSLMNTTTTFAIDICNNVFAWGYNLRNSFGPNYGYEGNNYIIPQDITNMFGGNTMVYIHWNRTLSFGIDSNGILYAWGTGFGTSNAIYTPIPTIMNNMINNGYITSINGKQIVSISSYASNHSYIGAIDTNGDLHAAYIAGGNTRDVGGYYYFGNSFYTSSIVYTNIFFNITQDPNSGSLYGKKIISAFYSNNLSYAIDTNGHVHTWGQQAYFGDGTVPDATPRPTPQNISIISNINSSIYGKKIVKMVKSTPIALLDSSGNIHMFGPANTGELGNSSIITTENAYAPINIMNVSGSSLNGKIITDIGRIERSFVALDTNGQVHTWGYGLQGNNDTLQLFNKVASLIPINISLTPGSPLYGVVVKKLGDVGVII